MGPGKPPAIVFVARHGARLDAADPQWHLTSPAPYDSPLTYGGWRQSQTLGARIASIIHNRADASEEPVFRRSGDEDDGHSVHHLRRVRRRKHKVVIHTSPFLRCVQTSIAIAAGIEQHHGNQGSGDRHRYPEPHALHSGSTHSRDHWNSPHLPAISEPNEMSAKRPNSTLVNPKHDSKALLRVDAFLGEWLSPDYFNDITTPPQSKMMVASAKADLLRDGDPIDTARSDGNQLSSRGHFPGGWKSGDSQPSQQTQVAVPGKVSIQQSGNLNNGIEHSQVSGYTPPTPSYAISPTQPVPQGYVAHARDACVKVDYQWDSLRPPLEWGTGGEYGEEWSSMHKRFRKGLHQMCTWYRIHEPYEDSQADEERSGSYHKQGHVSEVAEEEETDTVVILVTHGAGCNALIGALTNQPVLIDVGMASLTMAKRKSVGYQRLPQPDGSPESPSRRRRSSMDPGTSEDYDVKLIASTDHLRSGSQFLPSLTRSRSPSLPVREKSPYRYERHVKSPHIKSRPGKDHRDSVSPVSSPEFINFGGIQRSATAAVTSNGGLWSKPILNKVDDDVHDPISHKMSKSRDTDAPKEDVLSLRSKTLNTRTESDRASEPLANSKADVNGRNLEPQGLWGAPPLALAAERDKGSKRRWTLSQAS